MSVTANSSIKDWISLADFDGAQALGGGTVQLRIMPAIKVST